MHDVSIEKFSDFSAAIALRSASVSPSEFLGQSRRRRAANHPPTYALVGAGLCDVCFSRLQGFFDVLPRAFGSATVPHIPKLVTCGDLRLKPQVPVPIRVSMRRGRLRIQGPELSSVSRLQRLPNKKSMTSLPKVSRQRFLGAMQSLGFVFFVGSPVMCRSLNLKLMLVVAVPTPGLTVCRDTGMVIVTEFVDSSRRAPRPGLK